jgi:hypothetical protein
MVRIKYLILAISLVLIACGSSGGDKGSGNQTDPINPPSQCKSIFSEWSNDLDLERHDFAGRQLDTPYFYQFNSPVGTVCGGAPSASDEIELTISMGTSNAFVNGFAGSIQLEYRSFMTGNCEGLYDSGSSKVSYAIFKVECDKLTMCAVDGNGPFDCRTFH